MDVVDVEPAAIKSHGPGAVDGIIRIRLADCSQMPADWCVDRAKQGADRRLGIFAQAPLGLASVPQRLIYRMGQGSVDFIERLAEIAEINLKAAPSLGRIDAVGFDQPIIVVERLVAGVTRKPPRHGQERGDILIARTRGTQGFAAPDSLRYPAERKIDLD